LLPEGGWIVIERGREGEGQSSTVKEKTITLGPSRRISNILGDLNRAFVPEFPLLRRIKRTLSDRVSLPPLKHDSAVLACASSPSSGKSKKEKWLEKNH